MLDSFHKNISSINEHNLETRLEVRENSDNEIDLIGKEFNFMMRRIQKAYQQQKEFTAQASHELRTPIARMTVQLENLKSKTDEAGQQQIAQINRNLFALKELIDSLLLLARLESLSNRKQEHARIDEAVFNSMDKVHQQYPDLKVSLDVDAAIDSNLLSLPVNQALLEIAIGNLLKNAYLYSEDRQALISIREAGAHIELSIANIGPTLTEEEQHRMFQPFMRGANASEKQGFGLGLRMVQRILGAYHYDIRYIAGAQKNEFVITF
ncbi:MAG: HAMP domain-containing sensor histidine kinase [Chitinophagaceae bacterium]